jgi:dimethylhistidine N-methyltransferase
MNECQFFEVTPQQSDIHSEIIAGLSASPKILSPKFFYDEIGSQLFDQICELPEYYPTRTEIGLLKEYGCEIAETVGQDSVLLELGSGSSTKIRLLLELLRPSTYIPIDISKAHLQASANTIGQSYPWLTVHAICADYSQPWELPYPVIGENVAVFFPGSSIGNFEPDRAIDLLKTVGDKVGAGVGLLIGVDLKKDANILNSAYNDAQGVTADFNKNMLSHINQTMSANFDLKGFVHQAFYNESKGRIEMHLVSQKDQSIQVAGETIEFTKGESLHTECSYKYSIAEFQALAAHAGLEPVKVWQDDNALFSIHYLRYL